MRARPLSMTHSEMYLSNAHKRVRTRVLAIHRPYNYKELWRARWLAD